MLLEKNIALVTGGSLGIGTRGFGAGSQLVLGRQSRTEEVRVLIRNTQVAPVVSDVFGGRTGCLRVARCLLQPGFRLPGSGSRRTRTTVVHLLAQRLQAIAVHEESFEL